MAARRDPTGRQDNPVMASMLKSIDESLGRILKQLDDLGLADNTIIVFNSDNGGNIHSNTIDDAKSQRRNREDATAASYRKWAGQKPPTNNAPLRDGKGRLYEGGVRVPLIVRWPGKVKANKTNESIVGCIDFYPTILELTGITPKVNQKIDGRSYAGELLGTKAFDRDTYFIWFPHLVPGVSVRKGDWKLIRRFEERPSEYQGTRELFNLRQDLGETKNLAAEQPEKVKELDKLIDAFLQDTDALLPQPNPGYKPVSNSRTSPIDVAGTTVEELIKGLVTQQSKATRLADGIRVEATGKRPYLGTAAVKLNGPLTLRLRVRSEHGGTGEVKWRTADEAEFPRNGPSVEFAIQPSPQWQEVDVALPIEGTSAIIQLHLPAQSGPVDLQQIEYQDARGHKKGWTFVATPLK